MLASLLGTALIVPIKPFLAETSIFVPANDVSLTLSSPQRVYKSGDTVNLTYRITNVGNAPLYVPTEWEAKCPPRPHFGVWFENEKGEHFSTSYIVSNCVPPPRANAVLARMAKESILLRPGEHVDAYYPIRTSTFDFLKPGTYRFEALLSGWQEEEFGVQDQAELVKMKWPFMRGEMRASIQVVLTK